MSNRAKAILLAVLIAGMAMAAATLPVGDWLASGTAWIESHRALAWMAYVAAYAAAAVLVVPGTLLTLAAGFLFGLPVGVMLVSVGSLSGAAAAFLTGRFLARDWVRRRIQALPRFQALDKATRSRGFVIVLLTRLSPLFPFNLLNYAFGLTAVRFGDYVLASWIGMTPAIILYVYVGSAAKSLTAVVNGDLSGGAAGRALLFLGLAATLALTIVITRMATRTLSQHLAGDGRADPET